MKKLFYLLPFFIFVTFAYTQTRGIGSYFADKIYERMEPDDNDIKELARDIIGRKTVGTLKMTDIARYMITCLRTGLM